MVEDPLLNSIKVGFRKQEIGRRLARMKILLNHVKLGQERLSPEDEKICRKAEQELQLQQLALEKSITPGYWKRLFAAVCGR